MEPVKYDANGRMKYHPEYHPNQGKPFTPEENAYLCYWYERDSARDLCLALGRSETSLTTRIWQMKNTGDYEHYQNLWRYMMRN